MNNLIENRIRPNGANQTITFLRVNKLTITTPRGEFNFFNVAEATKRALANVHSAVRSFREIPKKIRAAHISEEIIMSAFQNQD